MGNSLPATRSPRVATLSTPPTVFKLNQRAKVDLLFSVPGGFRLFGSVRQCVPLKSRSPLIYNGSLLFLTTRTVKKELRPVNEELYDDYILDHYECPYHKGHIECPTCTHSEKNPLCGDQIRLELKLDDHGKVAEAFFNGKGCAISQAGASILCQHVEGKSLDELRGFQAPDMLRLLKVPLTATRQRCGLLGFKVLKTLMYSLDQPPAETDEPIAASSG